MKLDSPNIVEVTMESKETTTVLRTEVPDFDLVIVATGDQKGSAGMNGDTSNRAFVLFESVYEYAHAVVP
jgi:hypothetical protein